MNRIFYFTLLLVVLTSCSKEETTFLDKNTENNSNNIGIATVIDGISVSKVADVTTATLNTSGVELNVYTLDANSTTAWSYSSLFESDGENWISANQQPWSTVDFPATFYSIYDGTGAALNVDYSQEPSVQFSVTGSTARDASVNGDLNSCNQKDIVYAKNTIYQIPAGGKVPLVFNHALAKVNFFVGSGTNSVHIKSLKLRNIYETGVMKFGTKDMAPGIEVIGTKDYSYGYYLWDKTTAPNALRDGYAIMGDATNYTVPTSDAAFMLIPQTLTPIDLNHVYFNWAVAEHYFNGTSFYPWRVEMPEFGNSLLGKIIHPLGLNGSYVEVLYCATDNIGESAIGYKEGREHPDGDSSMDTPLYVKAIFPLEINLMAGKYYMLTLGMGIEGSTGGYLIDDRYYDNNGMRTDLETKEKLGEPIIPKEDAYIDIVVSAVEWEGEINYKP